MILAVLVGTGSAAQETLNSTLESMPGSDEWVAMIQAPRSSSGQQHRQYFATFRESLANKTYEEAETAAKLMVELASRGSDIDELNRSRTLQNLALAQQLGENYDAAILNYLMAINIIVRHEDMLSDTLVVSLRGLAAAYVGDDKPVEAFRTFNRALHISNVNHGPHSLDQLPILNAMMRIHLDQGDAKSAVEVLERIYLLHSRKFSSQSEEILPVLYQKAKILNELGRNVEERAAYRQIVRIIRQHRDESSIDLIEPYLQLGRTFVRDLDEVIFRSAPTAGTAETYLKKALSIAEENTQSDWRTKKKCLLALADYYTLVDMHSMARRRYQQAWELMSSDVSYLRQRAIDLESIVPLSQPHPHRYANFEYNPDREKIDPDDYLQGVLVVRYTVNVRGRAKDISVIGADPPEFKRMERRVRLALKKFVFRPRCADGLPVETTDQIYRHDYFYVQSEYQASLEKSGRLNRPVPPKVE
jgi:tetratricopeptide (TPR) repeat protein